MAVVFPSPEVVAHLQALAAVEFDDDSDEVRSGRRRARGFGYDRVSATALSDSDRRMLLSVIWSGTAWWFERWTRQVRRAVSRYDTYAWRRENPANSEERAAIRAAATDPTRDWALLDFDFVAEVFAPRVHHTLPAYRHRGFHRTLAATAARMSDAEAIRLFYLRFCPDISLGAADWYYRHLPTLKKVERTAAGVRFAAHYHALRERVASCDARVRAEVLDELRPELDADNARIRAERTPPVPVPA